MKQQIQKDFMSSTFNHLGIQMMKSRWHKAIVEDEAVELEVQLVKEELTDIINNMITGKIIKDQQVLEEWDSSQTQYSTA